MQPRHEKPAQHIAATRSLSKQRITRIGSNGNTAGKTRPPTRPSPSRQRHQEKRETNPSPAKDQLAIYRCN
ncbi:hypothetical protein [Lysobacter gummosus]|uniref:hypothetical protein n=1 Tax=Lysobacter gummosus TaxID=262324 RepID=UPI0036293BF6